MISWQFAGFVLCVVVASVTQNVTGFAMALVLLGLTGLFQLAPLPDVANVAMVLGIASAPVALRGAHDMDFRILRSTVSGSVFGVAAGVALLAWLSGSVVIVLRLLLGLVIVACAVIVLMRSHPLPQRSSPGSFRAYGFLSGLLGGLFSASGPPLVYHFYRQPMSLDAVRHTLRITLAVGSVIRLVMVVASGNFSREAVTMCLFAVPLVLGITWWMERHPPRWPRQAVVRIVCVLLMITGLGLTGPALKALASNA